MGHGYKHGANGSSLNFTVKTYPSETELKADKPRENTIGIITTTTMTSWVFSAKEPTEPQVGMVWISLGTSSTAEFNALNNNKLQVYPVIAKQYVNGAFAKVTALSYQNSEWKAWWGGELFKDGDQHTDYTGGWEVKGFQSNEGWAKDKTPTLNIGNTIDLTMTSTSNGNYSSLLITKEKIDVSGYNTLTIKCPKIELVGKSFYSSGVGILLLSSNDNSLYYNDLKVAYKSVKSATQAAMSHTDVTDSLDISECDGEYFVAVSFTMGGLHNVTSTTLTVKISELLLS